MDWSATLSLTTSRARQHRANYGSFGTTSSLSRHGSGTTISIPESIPEHQCVLQFSSPRLKHTEHSIVEHYDQVNSQVTSSTTMTITETTTSSWGSATNTFKMLLTSASTTSSINGNTRIDTDTPPTDEQPACSYWLQERERMMLKRKQRYPRQNGSLTKAASLREESSGWRTAAIMCSVPLVLVLVFVIIVLVFGNGTDAISNAPHWLARYITNDANADTNSQRLRRGLDANS